MVVTASRRSVDRGNSVFLAADIGGTHARVALMRAPSGEGHRLETLAYRSYPCAQFPSLAALLRAFLDTETQQPVRHCVLACAGQLVGEEVVNDNLPWPIGTGALRQALGLEHVAVLNDFEALGYALEGFAQQRRHLCGPTVASGGPVLVIGPGTGLGAVVHLPGAAGGVVLTTEAGQMAFAAHSLRERAVLSELAPQGGYVEVERIVSGRGLLTLYTALCALDGVAPSLQAPEAVTAAAQDDAQAAEAVSMFCAALGGLAGDLALAFMATGGVYLAGGFLSSMQAELARSAFHLRFLHGRSARTLLAPVPVWVVEHGRNGVLGAARWYLDKGLPAFPSGGQAA